MLRNQRLLKYFVLLAANFFTGLVAAEQCTAIFPGGIQSHSPSGVVQMGYMSRVFGSGPMLTAPTVTHTHSWQDQVGLCDGVKCTASGAHASTQNVEFLTGTEVPAVFELSASNNNVSNGYQAGALALPVADYGTVSVGQESTVRFTTVDSIYRTKTIKTNYKSVIEFQPGTYWVNGNLDWTAQDTRIRRLNGSNGRVTLYVSGNVNISQLHFEGFSEGQIRIYAKGSVTAGNDFIFPGEIHAGGRVGFGERAKITGGIYSGNFSTGNGAVVRYTRQNHDHRMGALNPAYNSTFELTPGNYWIDGGFDASVASKFRKVGGSGVVRLFVRGNVNVQHGASFEGFAGGDLVMYSTGKITLTSQTDLPAFVYAVGDVEINFSQGASYRGGITGRNVYLGQNSIVRYLDPVDLGPLCESGEAAAKIDHFEFVVGPGAHTCKPHTVTLKACTNAAPGVCELYPGDVAVSLASGGWIGGGNKQLVNGIGVFQLQGLQLQMTLELLDSLPVSVNQTLCQIGNATLSSACVLNFSQSGFIFDVPHMLANQEVENISLSAVTDLGEEGSPRCEPAFTNVQRNIKFWSEFISPSGGELTINSERVRVNDEGVAQSFAAAEPLSLYFDGDGVARINVNYREAGKMQLNARYAGSSNDDDSGLMIGSDEFVSTPAGFCIMPEEICLSGDSDCSAFRQVGQSFNAIIRPVAWSSGGNICLGKTTRNYRQSNLILEPIVVAPDGGNSGQVLEPVSRSYDHVPSGVAVDWSGKVSQAVSFSEVGVFRLQVAPPDMEYFDVTVPSSASEPIGRFYPTHLKVEGAGGLTAGCGPFSYQDQPIDIVTPLSLTITGYGRTAGGGEYVTENYDYDGFWGFKDRPVEVWMAEDRDLDIYRLTLDDDVIESGQNNSDGKRTYTWTAKQLSYERSSLPTVDDLPFYIRQSFSAAELTDDKDDVCYDLGAGCQGFERTITNSEIRLGRVRSENKIEPAEKQTKVPLVLEHWYGNGWVPQEDECTELIVPAENEDPILYSDGVTAASVSSWMDNKEVAVTVTEPLEPEGSVWLRRFLEQASSPTTWLCQKRSMEEAPLGGVCSYLDDAGPAEIRSSVTFGIYQGPKPLIFRRELYRGM
ncbi:DUF6701 domain-containing protein [Stutzerimonas stutzeri]|uniref:DUF6701 domain-containing protein n=1 Tax=Stutzerimonas stutzeri TaxID=316 RepID=UPI00210B64E9|nr:DUF6701 domain-containing protein [Stutzerimonas stutzeri]MCQ4241889.1 hypothetical protein [Stutzerimonas stutzeri]